MALGNSRVFDYPSRRLLQVRSGVQMLLVPGDHNALIEIERAPDSGGSPGTYLHLTTVHAPKQGMFYTDFLPNDGATRWYRARHATSGIYGNAGAYFTAFSAVPRILRHDVIVNQGASAPPFTRTEDILSDAVTPDKTLDRLRCRVTRTGNQTIANSTSTAVAWNAEVYDNGAMHDNATNNSRITVPSGQGNGQPILLVVQLQWEAAPVGDTSVYRQAHILKNGVTTLAATVTPFVSTAPTIQQMTVTDVPADGDYYEVKVFQSSGGDLDLELTHSSAMYFQAQLLP
jgi:hypothetical protein